MLLAAAWTAACWAAARWTQLGDGQQLLVETMDSSWGRRAARLTAASCCYLPSVGAAAWAASCWLQLPVLWWRGSEREEEERENGEGFYRVFAATPTGMGEREKERKSGRRRSGEGGTGGALVVVSASPYSSGLRMGCWLHALVALLAASGTSHELLGRACMCWV